MPELVTVIHPITGKPVTMLREFAEGGGCWVSPCAPSVEEIAWMREHFDVRGFLSDLHTLLTKQHQRNTAISAGV